MVLGGLGAIAQKDIRYILSYNVIIGVGFIISGLAILPKASNWAVYYLIHDMAMKTLLFLLGGAIMTIVGSGKLKEMGGTIVTIPY